MRYLFLLLTSTVAITTASHAAKAPDVASLNAVSGSVLVNAGEGFVAVPEGQPLALKAGDKIFVRDNSTATVAFADCAVALTEPTLFTVTAEAPCLNGSLPDQAVRITPTAGHEDRLAAQARVVGMGVSAAVLIGAGFVLIDALSNNENDPAS